MKGKLKEKTSTQDKLTFPLIMDLCNDSAPSSWFSTLTPPTFSFAPNVTPDNFKSPGLAPPPCPPSCPVTCMPHVTVERYENPK